MGCNLLPGVSDKHDLNNWRQCKTSVYGINNCLETILHRKPLKCEKIRIFSTSISTVYKIANCLVFLSTISNFAVSKNCKFAVYYKNSKMLYAKLYCKSFLQKFKNVVCQIVSQKHYIKIQKCCMPNCIAKAFYKNSKMLYAKLYRKSFL